MRSRWIVRLEKRGFCMKAFDLSHVKMVEGVEEMCGPFLMDVYNILFNENKISLEEAMRLVAAGIYSPYVLKIPQTQYEGLFKDRKVVVNKEKD